MHDSDSRHTGLRCLWQSTAPDAPPTAPVQGSLSADVVVIGGGFTGLSTALHLAKQGARAVVLEAREIGYGGSGRNVGLVNAGMWVRPSVVVEALGAEHGHRLLTLLGEGPRLVFDLIGQHDIRCDPVHNGTLHCSPDRRGEAELLQRYTEWRELGAPVSLLSEAETVRRTGTGLYRSALLDARAGTIQPLSYARGLAGAAIAAGARIFTNSGALRWERDGTAWSVATRDGKVRADWIVVATGAYTDGLREDIRTQQIHLPYFNFATQPLPAELRQSILPGNHGIWDTRSVLRSFRLDRDGRLVVGSVGALSGWHERVHREWALRSARKAFPQLKAVRMEFGWDGTIDMTDDNLPRLHRIEPQVICITGYNGRGIAPGTVFGRELARYITGELPENQLPLPISDPRRAKFGSMREAVYRMGASAVHWIG